MAARKKGNAAKTTKLDEILQNLDKVEELTRGGHSIEAIAGHFGVARSTFYEYMNKEPIISDAIKKGRATLITEVKSALTKRALGYDYEEVTTYIRRAGDKEVQTIEKKRKHQPPDVGACHLILKNLDQDWHNDDYRILQMKEKELELKTKQIEAQLW